MKIPFKLLTTLSLCAALSPFSTLAAEKASVQRLDQVERRGKRVMPFDLRLTTHVFNKTAFGGIQKVLVKNSADIEQLKLIRQHLQEIATQFQQGNYTSPAKIHGADMPGLKILKQAGKNQIKIDYLELTDGAQITYFSRQPKIIQAIQQWFEAQLSDHARHAVSEQQHHLIHKKLYSAQSPKTE